MSSSPAVATHRRTQPAAPGQTAPAADERPGAPAPAADGGAAESRSPSPAPSGAEVGTARAAAAATSTTTRPRSALTDPPRALTVPANRRHRPKETPTPLVPEFPAPTGGVWSQRRRRPEEADDARQSPARTPTSRCRSSRTEEPSCATTPRATRTSRWWTWMPLASRNSWFGNWSSRGRSHPAQPCMALRPELKIDKAAVCAPRLLAQAGPACHICLAFTPDRGVSRRG